LTPRPSQTSPGGSPRTRRIALRIVKLVQAVQRDPFEGLGQPEPLRHEFAGTWSRRIDGGHRLVYTVSESTIRIVACRYHYWVILCRRAFAGREIHTHRAWRLASGMKTFAVYLFAVLAVLTAVALAPAAAATEETFNLEPFGTLTLYHQGPRPAHMVLFVSGDGGWKLGVVDMARELEAMDALVVGINITHYIKTVVDAAAGQPEACFDPGKDFADLGKAVAERLGYPEGHEAPILAGYSSGATLVYAALVQAPPSTFAGAVSLGFCPDLIVNMPICKGNGLAWQRDPHHKGVDFLPSRVLEVPWIALQGDIDKICTPSDTRSYVSKVPHGELVWLHKVGHGFSVPKRWMAQFKSSFARIARSAERPGH
jgi:Txe/YoeB family toxin of toxin-antitoxin system